MAETHTGQIASEVSTGTTSGSGQRDSKDSDWTWVTVPSGFAINKNATTVDVISERGSEHSYDVQYKDDVEIIAGTGFSMPTTIGVKTHARSAASNFGGGGGEKVVVHYTYVKFG